MPDVLHCCAAACALLGALAAQSGGPTLAFAQTFSIDAATPVTGATPATHVFSRTDLDAAPPMPLWPPAPPGAPDFSTLPIPSTLDVDATSLGLDWVLATPAGVVDVPPGHWGAISYSVSRATVGTAGSLVAAEAAAPGGAAADVFCYVLPGSALPLAIVGVPFRAQDGTEISASLPGSPGNVDAHDLFAGLLYRENPQLAALLPPPTVYFSVTDATKAAIPPAWTTGVPPSGATVFRTTWIPMGPAGAWSPPSVYLAPGMLGLDPGEDLDALALDVLHGRVLLSTDPALPPPPPLPARVPLLYSNLGSGACGPYLLAFGGPPVYPELGIGIAPDDIDAICALDPGSPANPSQIRLERMVGTPGAALLGAPSLLRASLSRTFDPTTNREAFVTMMTGWPPPGTPAQGIAAVFVSLGGTWVPTPQIGRPNPGSPYFGFEGHPERFEWPIPAWVSLSGIPISFVWGALTFAPLTYDLSLPMTIVL